MEIEGKKYEAKLDLGADLSTLYPHDLNEMHKHPCGSHLSVGVRGNKYNRTIYEVFGVKFHEFYVPKMKVLEDSYEFAVNSVITGDPEQITYHGRIGREIFKGKNFFLDFASSKIIICSNFKDLAKDGYDLNNFIKVPFEINSTGICIRVGTDAGEQILNLDTGASRCFLRPPSEKIKVAFNSFSSPPNWRTQKFVLGDSEFGPRDFILFEISPLLEMIDGSLGVDFLKEHAVYIDTKKLVAYIEK